MLPVKSRCQGLKDPRAALQGRGGWGWASWGSACPFGQFERSSFLQKAAFWKSYPFSLSVGFLLSQKAGTVLIRLLLDLSVPSALTYHSNCQPGTWCWCHRGKSSSPGVFNSLTWTGKSQPSLLPLITPKFPEGIFACWAPEPRLFHNYRYAAQGLSCYSERLLLCGFADKYSSLY